MMALETHLAGCFAAAVATGDAEGAVKDVMAVGGVPHNHGD
jgi:hypothetical protein